MYKKNHNKNIFQLGILLTIFFVFALLLSNISNNSEIVYEEKNNNRIDAPKLSAGEINITTPLNITYTDSMSGYYPGTYSFENDEDGIVPEEWVLSENRGGTSQVLDAMGDHNKVVELYDDDNFWEVHLDSTFNAQTNGTIEWFCGTDSVSSVTSFLPYDDSTWAFQVYFTGGDIRYSDGASNYALFAYTINQWYHFRIDFNSTSDTYDFYINGTLQVNDASYQTSANDIEMLRIATGSSANNFHTYVDAVGYSWDPDYNIGDNLNEGLLLSYENNTNLEWTGYSLDGQINKTILGDSTIPLPSNGIHSLQVFGNDSLSTMYESDIRYFSVDRKNITIITPENKTYTEAMSGYYPATYGFENDTDGSYPTDWSIYTGGNSIQVVSSLDGHQKVVEFYDTTSDIATITDTFPAQATGSIELWIQGDSFSTTKNVQIKLGDSINPFTMLRTESGQLQYITSSIWYDLAPINNNQWHHIKLEFDDNTDTINVDLDGNRVLTGGNAWITTNPCDSLEIGTHTTDSAYKSYVDAIGYSWDNGYSIGDNEDEGLLLSYNNISNLEWAGYSLDGQITNTIYGNTTLKILSNGIHTIQVFGNNSVGTIFESDIRYFSINMDKNLNIVSPTNTTYLNPMSGYYPATYGFENDADGSTPYGWEDASGTNCYGDVISEIGGHNKVLRIVDNDGSSYAAQLYQSFSSQTSGTIEWWYRPTDADKYLSLTPFYDSRSDPAFYFSQGSYGWHYFDSGGWHTMTELGSVSDNVWYHISLDFECTTGNYKGLDQYYARAIVNEVESNPFPWVNNFTAWNEIRFNTFTPETYTCYVDAVGFSWDPNYNNGDNWHEGLLLSIDTNISPDWMGYSLDGQNNRTILGNTTIAIRNNGIHSIQVFCNDTLGTTYQTNITYFEATYVDETEPFFNTKPPSEFNVDQFSSFLLTWNISDTNNWKFEILQNGSVIDSGLFSNNENKTVLVDSSTIQDLNYTILAWDTWYNIAQHTVIVHVEDNTDPYFTSIVYDPTLYKGEECNISWRIIEDNVDYYVIYRNGTLVEPATGYTSNTENGFTELNWTVGDILYTIVAYDASGNSNSTEILISILERVDEFNFVAPGEITPINDISGLSMDFSANAPGYLIAELLSSFIEGLEDAKFKGGKLNPYSYYNFTVFNETFGEDDSIMNYITIRFYYDDNAVDEDELYLLHYLWDFDEKIWVWEAMDIIINKDANYVQFNTTDLSIFCLAELKLPPGQEDKEPDLWMFITENMLIIVLLSALGIGIPSAYVITSKKKKKKEIEKKKLEDYQDMAFKAKEKKEALAKRAWAPEPETIAKKEPRKLVKVPGVETVKPAVSLQPKKKKKPEKPKKPLTKEEREKIRREIEEIEKEMDVQKKEDFCQVHRGTLKGVTYVCPECGSKYCLKCAETLMNKDEACWSCKAPINLKSDSDDSNKVDGNILISNGAEKLLYLLSQDIPLEDIEELNEMNITSLSHIFMKKFNKLKMFGEDKEKFLKDMLSLTPEERNEIIDRMLESDSEDFLG